MRYWNLSIVCAMAVLITAVTARPASAEDGNVIATVSFGIGLNTAVAPPANGEPNHHVLPQRIRIKKGGVVNFMVAGFHQIIVYKPKKDLDEINLTSVGPFINDGAETYYVGINPAGGPLATPATANPANGGNRVESVSFKDPGTYLVICNVRGHFMDGMYAWVEVRGGNDND
jgi:plastocyanin